MRRATTWLAAVGLIALIVLVCALAAWNRNANTRRCHNQGGTVVTDHDTDRRYNKRTGKWETHHSTEHECVVNGVEVFEW